jgi:hypothetical protein
VQVFLYLRSERSLLYVRPFKEGLRDVDDGVHLLIKMKKKKNRNNYEIRLQDIRKRNNQLEFDVCRRRFSRIEHRENNEIFESRFFA